MGLLSSLDGGKVHDWMVKEGKKIVGHLFDHPDELPRLWRETITIYCI